jgi:PKD repeat protein
MALTYLRRATVALALLAGISCTVKDSEQPPLAGPSGLALTLTVNAVPDSIRQDGGDQSAIRVLAIGPNGRPVSGLPVRIDMFVNGTAQDYGVLSARSIVTGSDGVASVVYTAPPSPVNGVSGTCHTLPGNCVSIVATATSADFAAANPQSVEIRLVPPGVILPPASTPVPSFTISPSPVNFNVASIFDASGSTPGSGSGGITNYAWSFGDGTFDSGKTVSHTFKSGSSSSPSFQVTLTVTNDRNLSASSTQVVGVSAAPLPTGTFTFSPGAPLVNQSIVFNADSIRAAAGHSIVDFSWIFGDGAVASGSLTTHAFAAPGSYNVTLTVTDEVGSKLTVTNQVAVTGNTGAPFANFTFSPASPVAVGTVVSFDASSSTAANGTTIQTYMWNFGDVPVSTTLVNTASPIASHTYTAAGTYQVSLIVQDSQGRTSVVLTRAIQVQ